MLSVDDRNIVQTGGQPTEVHSLLDGSVGLVGCFIHRLSNSILNANDIATRFCSGHTYSKQTFVGHRVHPTGEAFSICYTNIGNQTIRLSRTAAIEGHNHIIDAVDSRNVGLTGSASNRNTINIPLVSGRYWCVFSLPRTLYSTVGLSSFFSSSIFADRNLWPFGARWDRLRHGFVDNFGIYRGAYFRILI